MIQDPSLSQARAAELYRTHQPTVSYWLSKLREEAPERLPEHLRESRHAAPLTLNDILNKPAVQAMFKDPSLTQTKAADLFNTPQPYLSRWLGRVAAEAPELLPHHLKDIKPRPTGKPRPKPNARPSHLSRFGAPHAYPVYAYARAGAADVAPQFDGHPIDAFHTDIRIPERPPILPFALRVRGDSMVNPLEPDSPDNLPEGTDVLINPHIEPRMGDYVAAADLESEGGTIVKEYALAPIDPANPSGAKQLSLRSLNPKYAPERLDERFRILGVVVDSRKPSYRRGRRF
ncbi:S24 family peptidase [Comamonadaceae bacterium OH2545_COT-014]|nr:S24 family peptidase [Comamonadaceae bacterium OH2545_COT-014]